MSNWTLAKYTKMCKDCRSDAESEYQDMLESSELWYDIAQCMLDNEDGLEEFMKTKLNITDIKGCLADDLAFPGNCNNYIINSKRK